MAKRVISLIVSLISINTLVCANLGGAHDSFNIDNSLTQFGEQLFLTINSTNGFVVSPISMYIPLSLLSLGAINRTAAEIWDVLYIRDTNSSEFAAAMMNYMQTLLDEPTLTLKTKIFINETQVNKDFVRMATLYFDCDTQEVDYNDANTMNVITHWIVDQVHNFSVNSAITAMYFPNDLYVASIISFNAEWENQFDVAATTNGTFTTNSGEDVVVEYMYQEGYFPFYAANGDSFLIIPYKNTNWTLMLLQSDEPTTTQNLEEKTKINYLRSVQSKMRNLPPTYVKLWLPKFQAIFNHDLSEFLPQMGADLMFGPDADFSGILADPNYVSFSVFDMGFSVDEWGTGVAPDETSKRDMGTETKDNVDVINVEFIVNNPFIFFISDDTENAFFLGLVTNPQNAFTDV